MRKLFLVAFLAVGTSFASEGDSLNGRFAAANQLFEKGDMVKAGEIYQSLIAQGFEGAELYYNLGNLHYRRGERGKAVLWYERAARLKPRDADIRFNRTLARSHIKDEEGDLLRKIFMTFTGDELSAALTVLLWLFFGLIGARTIGWIKNESWPGVAIGVNGFLLAMMAGWFAVAVAMERQPMGIVINPPGEVRNGPGMDYAVGFTVPEGSSVLLLNRRPDWTQVGLPEQGLKGWMPNAEIEAVEITPASLN